MEKIGLYIHIPFCVSKCYYCNFNSIACEKLDEKEKLIEEYQKALVKEIVNMSELLSNYEIDTIYFGGGTPSYVDSKYICEILSLVNLFCDISKAQITIEINPGTITKQKMQDYIKAGINRVSIGMQSTDNDTLKKIGRIHTYEQFIECVKIVKEAEIKDFSFDYIVGLPGQTIESSIKEIEKVLLLDPTHMSIYDLEVHENGKLDFLINSGYVSVLSDDEVVDVRHTVQKVLEKHGYERYEISNYSKKGYQSKHNNKYWNQEKYIGIGAGAASFINGMRIKNVDNINEYIEKINIGESVSNVEENMDLLDLMKEYIILRLRLKDGINKNIFKAKFKEDIDKYFNTEIEYLKENKLINEDNEKVYLTEKGFDLANIVFEKFI